MALRTRTFTSSIGCSTSEEIRVHSRRQESREAFGNRLESDLGKTVSVSDTWQECLEGADIMMEAASLPNPRPLLKTRWVQPGTLVIPYGTMSAVELTLTDIMDKIVVDDWSQCQPGQPFGALRQHVDADKLTVNNLHAELGESVRAQVWSRKRSGDQPALASRSKHDGCCAG